MPDQATHRAPAKCRSSRYTVRPGGEPNAAQHKILPRLGT
jgi:hypothetical protein